MRQAARWARRHPRSSRRREYANVGRRRGRRTRPALRWAPGGGCGVAGRKEPVLSVTLAGTFASSCAAQVLDAVQDEVGVSIVPSRNRYIFICTPRRGVLTNQHRE